MYIFISNKSKKNVLGRRSHKKCGYEFIVCRRIEPRSIDIPQYGQHSLDIFIQIRRF